MKLEELQPSDRNYRVISEQQEQLLKDSLEEFGDLSGVIFNRTTGQLVGGHQRVAIFTDAEPKIVIEQEFDKPTAIGTVAHGYIDYLKERWTYREVEWELDKEMKANLQANQLGGKFDYLALVENYELQELREMGFEEYELPQEAYIPEQDKEILKDAKVIYDQGKVKQLVLFTTRADFRQLDYAISIYAAENECGSKSEAILKRINEYSRP